MQIRNVRPYDLTIAPTDQTVEPGGVVDVDDVLAASLLEQPENWAKVTPAKK